MSSRKEIENVGLSNSAELYFGVENEAGEVKSLEKSCKSDKFENGKFHLNATKYSQQNIKQIANLHVKDERAEHFHCFNRN